MSPYCKAGHVLDACTCPMSHAAPAKQCFDGKTCSSMCSKPIDAAGIVPRCSLLDIDEIAQYVIRTAYERQEGTIQVSLCCVKL